MERSLDKYVREHSSPLPETLEWIVRQTHLRTHYPQMLSGPVQGGLLKMLVSVTGARNILEIGTFTGYSAACMALALPEGGHIDTVETNDELEDLIREGWQRAGVSDRITLHIADALEFLGGQTQREIYDIIFIDANKRRYTDYYDAALPLLKRGGILIADDVLQGGKPYDPDFSDPQTRGLREFNDLISADRRVEAVVLPLPDGLTLARKL